MDQLREQLLDAFRQQMEIRKSLMELENSNMEIQMDMSKHLHTITESVSQENVVTTLHVVGSVPKIFLSHL